MPDPRILASSGNPQPAASVSSPPRAEAGPPPVRRRLMLLAALTAFLALCFGLPLYDLSGYVAHSQYFSYIPLIPVIIAYLCWIRRETWMPKVKPGWRAAIPVAGAGLGILGVFGWAIYSGWSPVVDDYLACMMPAFVVFLAAAGFAALGTRAMASLTFPVSLLIFMIPYPVVMLDALENFFQHTSAAAAYAMLHLAGARVIYQGLNLTLPDVAPFGNVFSYGLILHVAPECSGIHSSLVLLITSLLAGNLFLRTPWKRALLAVLVVPLAILRNGFRIFTLSELSIHVNRGIMDGPIHHQGGPVFFALSLIPFFFILVYLRKTEGLRPQGVPIEKDGPKKGLV